MKEKLITAYAVEDMNGGSHFFLGERLANHWLWDCWNKKKVKVTIEQAKRIARHSRLNKKLHKEASVILRNKDIPWWDHDLE
jgi:hypothetical protein